MTLAAIDPRIVGIVVGALWVGALAGAGMLLRVWWTKSQVRRRLSPDDEAEEAADVSSELRRSWLGWKLYRAGFRSRNATTAFLSLTGIFFLIGVAFGVGAYLLGAVDVAVRLLYLIPGGVGEVFLPLAWGSPWISAALLTAIPWLVVRARRKRRIASVEQDLPITLDLLAALAEAGIGFDAALTRILETQRHDRPLAQELRIFLVDVLAGRSRVESLRRLTERVDVVWFSIFASAVIQAEQIGGGLAQTLRTQADDLRSRRRERALAMAMAIPVKLLFPLIVCFLPGLMIAAIGPTAYQIVQTLDRFLVQSGATP